MQNQETKVRYRTVTNKEVARLWSEGVPAQNAKNRSGQRTFWTDGVYLFSYALCIGYINSEGDRVVINHRSTITTAKHRGLGAYYADANTYPESVPVDLPHGARYE